MVRIEPCNPSPVGRNDRPLPESIVQFDGSASFGRHSPQSCPVVRTDSCECNPFSVWGKLRKRFAAGLDHHSQIAAVHIHFPNNGTAVPVRNPCHLLPVPGNGGVIVVSAQCQLLTICAVRVQGPDTPPP